MLVNTLLDACIRLRDVKRLTAALSTFRGSGVVPSEHAYGTVIKAYGHARAVDEAWATWKEMLSRKVTPSDATVATMVEACVANGAASDARSVLADMRAAGAKVGLLLCNSAEMCASPCQAVVGSKFIIEPAHAPRREK